MEVDFIEGDWIYDTETYPNIFTFCAVYANGSGMRVFEISDRKDELEELLDFLRNVKKHKHRLVGFNNLGFDYNIIHHILEKAKKNKGKAFVVTAKEIYKIAMDIIKSQGDDRFGKIIRTADIIIPQVDLYKIHHFDNKAKATSLKMLEFNMRSDNIEDLPFPVGKILTHDEMDTLIVYNKHDVLQTLKFCNKSLKAIRFRADLTEKYGFDCTNYNDTKIGKEYFINRLEKAIPGCCYTPGKFGRKMNQTKREFIALNEVVFPYIKFERPEFNALLNWFNDRVITETKGVFTDILESELGDVKPYATLRTKRQKFSKKPSEDDLSEFYSQYPMGWVEEEELKATEWLKDENGEHVLEEVNGKMKKVRVNKISYWKCWNIADALNVNVDGFQLIFGTGGIHGSVESQIVESDDEWVIRDADVASYYPNVAIVNRVYPKHLSETFCDIYKDVYEERKKHPKGSPENDVMKLALNGVYGDSNNQYSPFFDPQYTMAITINGQLSLCMLIEKLLPIEGLTMVQANTDGITVRLRRKDIPQYDEIIKWWESTTKLEMELNNYSKMIIRDVNNYIALFEGNNKTKRKGAYEYEDLGWHQNHSALVVQMAVEAELMTGVHAHDFILEHKDKWDFMLRTKVPRSSKLVMVMEDGTEIQQQNICRYYPSENGGKLIKIMPPLAGKEEDGDRRLGIDVIWNVKTCNDINDFDWDINYNYYFNEADKLIDIFYEGEIIEQTSDD